MMIMCEFINNRFFILFFGLFVVGSFAQEKEKATVLQVPDSRIKEIIIHTSPRQNLENMVWDMGPYYFCKFSRDDEKRAVLDGWILIPPHRMEYLRQMVARDHNVLAMDVSFISGTENALFSEFEVCAGTTKYSYVRRGKDFTWYRKLIKKKDSN